jgi:hypothetical protein
MVLAAQQEQSEENKPQEEEPKKIGMMGQSKIKLDLTKVSTFTKVLKPI